MFKKINLKQGKDPNEPPKWMTQKAANAYAAYEKLKESSQIMGFSGSQCSKSVVNDFELFLNAVGGKKKKGCIYGFGSEASLLGRPTCDGNFSGYLSDVLDLMHKKIAALTEELQSMKSKLDKVLPNENVDENDDDDSEETEEDDRIDSDV